MTLEAKAAILGVFAIGLALVLQMQPASRISTNADVTGRAPTLMAGSLATVAMALILVGLVSGTLRPHLVQISPLVLLAVLSRAHPWTPAATGAVLSWWLVTMAGIWLFLLGLSRFLTGTFSPAEIVLTLVIGAACIVGLSTTGKARAIPLPSRLLVIVSAAGLQSLALWLSYQPIVLGR